MTDKCDKWDFDQKNRRDAPTPIDELVKRLRAPWTYTEGKREILCNEAAAALERLVSLERTSRWNIEEDGSDLLICDGTHEKSERCEYKRYVLAAERDSLRAGASAQQTQISDDAGVLRPEAFGAIGDKSAWTVKEALERLQINAVIMREAMVEAEKALGSSESYLEFLDSCDEGSDEGPIVLGKVKAALAKLRGVKWASRDHRSE